VRATYQFTVAAPGFEVLQFRAVVWPGVPLTIALHRNPALRGVVVDGSGAPVAGATLQLATMEPGFRTWTPGVQSDARGEFRLSTPSDGSWDYTVCASAPGFARALEPVGPIREERRETLRIVLQREASIEGVVEDPAGNGIQGALVTAYRVEPRAAVQSVAAGAKGQFTIRGLAAGDEYELVARHAGRGPASARAREGRLPAPLVLVPGGKLQFELQGAVPALDGTVAATVTLRKDTHNSIDAWYSNLYAIRLFSRTFEIDTDGPAEYAMMVEVPGRAPVIPDAVRVDPGGVVRVPVPLGPGARLRGKVIAKKTGVPLAGAGVVLLAPRHPNGSLGDRTPLAAESGADGTFTLEGAPAGRFDLWFEKQDFTGKNIQFTVQGADLDAGTIALTKPSVLRGRIVGLNPVPAGARVFLDTPVGGRVNWDLKGEDRYECDFLIRGEWRVGVNVPGVGDCGTQKLFVDDDATIDLDLVVGPAMLRGRIPGYDKNTGGRWRVFLMHPTKKIQIASAPVDTEGQFRFGGLPAGPVVALLEGTRANASVLATAVLDLKPGDNDVSLEVASTQLDVQVEGSDGQPLANMDVSVARADGRAHRPLFAASTGATGALSILGLAPGDYQIYCWGKGYEYASRWNANINKDGKATVRVRLRRESAIQFTIHDAAGKPVADARAQVARNHEHYENTEKWWPADPLGAVRAGGLSEQPCDALVIAPGMFPFLQELTLPAEATVPLEVVLFPLGQLEVSFVDAKGQPAPSAAIDIVPRDPRVRGTLATWLARGWVGVETSQSGVRLRGLPAGADLVVTAGAAVAAVRIEPGKLGEVALVVR
jgi:hypothetical protein